jgi:hypothetical protein
LGQLIQVKRGTRSQRLGFTPAAGEPVFETDTGHLYVGDGVTAGGIYSGSPLSGIIALTVDQSIYNVDISAFNLTAKPQGAVFNLVGTAIRQPGFGAHVIDDGTSTTASNLKVETDSNPTVSGLKLIFILIP